MLTYSKKTKFYFAFFLYISIETMFLLYFYQRADFDLLF